MGFGFGSLEIARSGLFVNERGLYVTGHNISNVNTPGYVRQQAVIADAGYNNMWPYQLGMGANVQDIRQIRHTFIDNVYRQEVKHLGYWEARSKVYQEIEAILREPMENGLQHFMNQFWDAWQELSKDPSSLTVRALVRQRGESLAQYINHLGTQLDKIQTDLDSEIKVIISEINSLTETVAKLNSLISQLEIAGESANDYRDQRNLALDKLSRLIDCDIVEMQDGQIDVIVGGYFLVTKSHHEVITAVQNKDGSLFCAPAIHGGKTLLPVKGGLLKGLLEARGEVQYNKGSLENGSSCDRVDLIFAFNINDDGTQRDNLLKQIDAIVKNYTDRGIGVRLGFVAFDDTTVTPPVFESFTLDSRGVAIPDIESFKNNISSALSFNGSGSPGGLALDALLEAAQAVEALDISSDWRNAARQFVLLSDSGINPNDSMGRDVWALARLLDEKRVNTLVLTDTSNPASLSQLKTLAEVTGDRIIDSGLSTDTTIGDIISESIRNSVYGDVASTMNIVPDIRDRLNLLVSALVREVNRLHRSGMTIGSDSHPGEDFFVPIDPNYPLEMGNIRINPNLSNLNNIVTSLDGSAGDNTIAQEIANLRNLQILGNFDEVQTFDSFYRSIVAMVGNGGAEASRICESQEFVVRAVDNQRNSIMGVSLDEEMTNMMKYQHAYGASARVLNIIDEMLESIINRMGIVGR